MKLTQTAKVPLLTDTQTDFRGSGCRGWRPDKHAKWKLVFWDLLAGCWDESEKRAKSNITCHQLESWCPATHGSIIVQRSEKVYSCCGQAKGERKTCNRQRRAANENGQREEPISVQTRTRVLQGNILPKKKKLSVNSDPLLSIHCSCHVKHLSKFDMFSWSFKEDNKFKCRKLLFAVQYINSSQMDLLSNERIL